MTDTKTELNFDNIYGYVIIKKGIKLFHKTNISFNKINDNSIFGIKIDDINQFGKNLLIYESLKDLKLLLTFRHKHDNPSRTVEKKLFEIALKLNIEINVNDEIIGIKRDKTVFTNLCNNLKYLGYNGFFNLIEGKYNDYEIVIFDSNNVQEITDHQRCLNIVYDNCRNYLNIGQYFSFHIPYKLKINEKYNTYEKDYQGKYLYNIINKISEDNNIGYVCENPSMKLSDYFEVEISTIDNELPIFKFPKVNIYEAKLTQ